MVPVEVEGVRLERAEPTEPTEPVVLTPEDRTYVMLRSPERSRALDIQIGPAEAFAISYALEGKRWDRPMTHDLLGEVIAALGATLRQVFITEYREDDVYIAEIEVTNQDGNAIRISARPSDAVALALRLDAPILVNEALFADAA
jgi:bifunctional DNase/RNase